MNRDVFRTSSVHGHVRGRWVAPALERGISTIPPAPVFDTHNMLSYAAAGVLAAAYGGDTTRVPKYVGFIYSGNKDAVLDPIDRSMSLATIQADVESIHGNMLVVQFSRKPSIVQDMPEDSTDSTDGVTSSTVEFYAKTRSDRDGFYANPVDAESKYCGPLVSGMAIHRAVLLGDGENPCARGDRYTVLAMVELKKNNEYRLKPKHYELALEWRVTFE